MKIYISLPISGKDEDTQRSKAERWVRYFEDKGYNTVNPFDLSDNLKAVHRRFEKREPTYDEYMRVDLFNLDTCTHIFMCDGHEQSNGCRMELERAKERGLEVIYQKTDALIERVITYMVHDILDKGIDVFDLQMAVYEALGIETEEELF